MDDKKLELIFRMVINDIVLNNQNLINNGFSNEEISKLIEMKIIQTTKSGVYKFIAVEDLRKYGVKRIFMKDGREANRCFKKCFQLASNGRNICLQYLLALIKKSNYDEALEVYHNLVRNNSSKYYKDNNLYLYLLSVIVELDSEYAEIVKGFKYSDLMLYENKENKIECKIRKAILQSKFTYAYKLIVDYMSGKKEYSLKYELIRELLVHALEAEKVFKSNLLNLAKNEDYDEILKLLQNREKQRDLSKLENYIILIVEAIIDIMLTGEVMEPAFNECNSLYEALVGNNFRLALKLNNEFLEYNNENPCDDIVNILLLKINELINEIEDGKVFEEENENDIDDVGIFDVKNAEEIAYYIRSKNISIDEYVKSVGLLKKYVLLVKLVYARDYYIEGDYTNGDMLVRDVEKHFNMDDSVLEFLNEIKVNRNNYRKQNEVYVRKLKQ